MECKFRSSETNKLAKNFLFIVDNGAGEQPASPLVQMLVIRMRYLLGLKSFTQVSYAEYNRKINFVERVHAEENRVLSRHGPFLSKMAHSVYRTGSDEHRANMEQMATETISCLREARFDGEPLKSFRGK